MIIAKRVTQNDFTRTTTFLYEEDPTTAELKAAAIAKKLNKLMNDESIEDYDVAVYSEEVFTALFNGTTIE